MQTFLPHPEFDESAACLDYKRLGKQRLEAKTIIDILDGKAKRDKRGNIPWANHPAVRMWSGYVGALKLYFNCILDEWENRGYVNNMKRAVIHSQSTDVPPWLGDPEFHASHRSNLLRKDPVFYGQFNWREQDSMAYVWPNPI